MPFYTYRNKLTGEEKEFLLPLQHEFPKDKHGHPMTRVYKGSHHIIPTNLDHEKSASYQQGAISEKGY